MSIQAIDRTSVHRLTSGQVVIDLQTAVKELVENALDAGATSISVKFREHGLEEIQVEDNGRGIEKEDWPGLALKHHTSKLTSFDDLATVSTLGFRGEALSSLCGVATLSMTTSTSPTLPLGTALAFTPAGDCIVGGKVPRSRGTTVKVERLFEQLPVRRKELDKNAKREMGKAVEMVQAYALIKTGVRFEVRNLVKSKSQVLLHTPISTTLRANFSNLFAPKSLPSLLDLDITLEVPTEKTVIKRLEGASESSTTVRVKGLISKPSAPHGRPAGNRQFYYINGRPFAPAKVTKAVNECYKSFNANQFPTVVADFQLAPDAYDVNVSPDKRTIFLHSEGNLITCLKEALARFFEPEKGTFAMQAIGPAQSTLATGANLAIKSEDEDPGAAEPDLEPPRKKRRDENGSPVASTPASSRTRASSNAVSRSPSVVIEVTNPIPPLRDEEVFLPEPPARFYGEEGSSEDAKPVVVDVPVADLPQSPAAVVSGDEGAHPAPLFRRNESPTPRPPPLRGSSPLVDPDDQLEESAAPTRSAMSGPAPRLAQTKLTFLGGENNQARNSRGKNRPPFSTRPASSTGESSTGRMQGLLRQFLHGAPRSEAIDDIAADIDELDDDDVEGRQAVSDIEEGGNPDRDNLPVGSSSPLLASPTGDLEALDSVRNDERDLVHCSEGMHDETGSSAPDALSDQPEDIVMDVGDSFSAVSATPDRPAPAVDHATDVDDVVEEEADDLEIIEASCACVHGSLGSDAEVEVLSPAPAAPDPTPPAVTALPFGAAPSEVVGTLVAADAQVAFDFGKLEQLWSASSPSSSAPRTSVAAEAPVPLEQEALAGAGIEERDDAAEATLSRVVSKADFDAMQVVGQFNLGFIIARRRVEAKVDVSGHELHDDLFIVDQHASDEKYNFERLQAETVIQSQRLLAPRVLNLPSADEITAMEHVDVLRLNGFDVQIDEDAGVGERVKLTAQPVSRDTVFDVGDLEELVELIATSGGSEVARPTKARRMFASRACRKSVMIGKALNHKQMTTILQHMGQMEQPWACPHGRPTMRWLASVGCGRAAAAAAACGDLRKTLEVLLLQ
ncbi:hypothetical protein JCM3774_005352 [Rhodotorula dairenensis]